jgi:hypothetical protein
MAVESMSQIAVLAPAAAIFSASNRPMPLAPPVINTRLFS